METVAYYLFHAFAAHGYLGYGYLTSKNVIVAGHLTGNNVAGHLRASAQRMRMSWLRIENHHIKLLNNWRSWVFV